MIRVLNDMCFENDQDSVTPFFVCVCILQILIKILHYIYNWSILNDCIQRYSCYSENTKIPFYKSDVKQKGTVINHTDKVATKE